MRLFRNESSHAKVNAQRNLCGRTHYVDDDTLRWHKSRVLAARVIDKGLLLAITTSDALNMDNTKRGFRYVIFDVFGTVLARPELKESFKRREQCDKAMWAVLNALDAREHTLVAIEDVRKAQMRELDELRGTVIDLAPVEQVA
jgi:hypothetical protein